MVYKKIRNKIPSLSSLLLAGVLLGSNCGKGKKDNAGEQTKKNTEKVGEKEKPKDASGKPLSKDYIKVVKDIYQYLLRDVACITRLKNKPSTIALDDLTASNAVDRLETFCSKFADGTNMEVYHPDVREALKSISALKFRSSGGSSGTKHKYAHGTALKCISDVWVNLSNYYNKILKLIDDGASEIQMAELLGQLDDYCKKNIGTASNPVLKDSTEFVDTKDCKLLDGERLARFLTDKKFDKERNITDKNPAFGMPALLGEEIKEVWIMGKSREDNERLAKIENLVRRGTGISNTWEEQGKAPMPNIDPFPNSNAVDVASDTSPVEAPVQVDVTFGQFITTLFNGNGAMDFVHFTANQDVSDQSLQLVTIKGDNEKFQQVLNKARISGEDRHDFAEALGQHIESQHTKLMDLFCIVDVTDIQNKIMADIPNDPKAIVNNGGEENVSFDPANIKPATYAAKFLENVVKILGNNQVSPADTFATCQGYVDDELSYTSFLRSDASIDQKITLKVIVNLFKDQNQSTLLLSNQADSLGKLLKFIEESIKKEADKAVVYKEDGKFKTTPVTAQIQSWISQTADKLMKKRNNAVIKYSSITTETNGIFKIKDVVDGMIKDYGSIRGILTAKVPLFLNKESVLLENKSYKTYFPDQDLLSENIKNINEKKMQYVDKNKG